MKGGPMSQDNNSFDPFDPTGMFKSMRDSSMASWSKMMMEFVNTEAYAKATGTMLDAWLSSSAPFRKALESSMTQVLAKLNMPNRADVVGLAERLTNIEMRLDDIEAKLDEYLRTTRKSPSAKTKPSSGEGHK
jgi:hypothetical protein